MIKTLVVVLSIVLLVGCSAVRNAGDDPLQTQQGRAQGFYIGSAAGSTYYTVVLPTDAVYSMYVTTTPSRVYPLGLLTGQGTSTMYSYSAPVTDYGFNGLTTKATLEAGYTLGTNLNATLKEAGLMMTINSKAPPLAQFDFSTAALMNQIAGTWNGIYLDGTTGSLTVTPSGSLSGSISGCSFTGTVRRDINRNFFNLSIKYDASPCLHPGDVVTGVAVVYLLDDGITYQLIIGGTSKTSASVFFGNRTAGMN